jgi:hypothetical protein
MGEDMNEAEGSDVQRPLGLTLITGLYLFFFLLTSSTYGNPFPLMGHIFVDEAARYIVIADSIICLYLFLGMLKKQLLTWYLLIGYNIFEVVNTIVNLTCITVHDLEKVLGNHVNIEAVKVNNVALALAILLLTQYIYRHKHFFTNRQNYLF